MGDDRGAGRGLREPDGAHRGHARDRRRARGARKATELHVEIRGGAEGTPPESYALRYERTVPASWPSRIALVPLDPVPPRAWSARVEALTVEGDPVAETTVRGGYADMRTVLVRVVLEDACVGVRCDDQRCDSGLCVDPVVDVASAPDLEE